MKRLLLSLSLMTFSLSVMASAQSCIPYYQSRLAVLGSRLKTLGIASPVTSVVAGLSVSPALAIPALVLVEEVVRLQIESAHRTSVVHVITDAKKITDPEWSDGTDLSPDTIKFYIKVFNKYPSLGDGNGTVVSMKKIAAKILEADQKKIFCNGSLKKNGRKKNDFKFKKNLATKREFKNFVDHMIEDSFL